MPFADISYAAAFADDHHHNQWGVGAADAQGRFIWNVVVSPAVPLGEASVVAAALRNDQGGAGQDTFEVASVGGCS